MKYEARIIINDQANDGEYTKSFILKMLKMGALICVCLDNGVSLFLEEKADLKIFKELRS